MDYLRLTSKPLVVAHGAQARKENPLFAKNDVWENLHLWYRMVSAKCSRIACRDGFTNPSLKPGLRRRGHIAEMKSGKNQFKIFTFLVCAPVFVSRLAFPFVQYQVSYCSFVLWKGELPQNLLSAKLRKIHKQYNIYNFMFILTICNTHNQILRAKPCSCVFKMFSGDLLLEKK